MKHVFVETNFLVDLLRPFPMRDAASLFGRVGNDVTLYLPWVSVPEAKRTLSSTIMKSDLGFAGSVKKFGVKLLRSGTIQPGEMPSIDTLEQRIKDALRDALRNVDSSVDNAVSKMTVIPPSSGVVAKTMALYPVKSLPPFDEMILGAVLHHAKSLLSSGKNELYFCNANTNDFTPTSGNTLGSEYAASGLTFIPDFNVPT